MKEPSQTPRGLPESTPVSTRAEILLKEFGESIGIEDLGFDEDKACILELDEDVVCFYPAGDTDIKMMTSFDIDATANAGQLKKMLNMNFEMVGEYIFSMDVSGLPCLMTQISLENMTTIGFTKKLTGLLDLLKECREEIFSSGDRTLPASTMVSTTHLV